MATISSTIRLRDGMTSVLRSMNNALNSVLNTFESVQSVSGKSINAASIQSAREEIARVNVALDEVEDSIREADERQKKLNQDMGKGRGIADGLARKITGFVGAYAGLQSVQKLLNLSDTMGQTDARLNLILDEGGSIDGMRQKIYDVAQGTRAPFMATADMVAKLGLQAGQAFSSNDELIAFAEQLNKQFVIAGTSVQGVESVMLQLTQAMASGKLQGEELNAVLDNAQPIVASIKRYLEEVQNIDASNIKQLASEGVLTADVIKNAMFYVAEETNEKFSDMPVTFAQAWQGIQDDLLMTFEPVLSTIAQGAGWIHDNWSDIEPIFWGLTAAAGTYAVALGAQTAATWLAKIANDGLMASLLANPLTWIVVGVGLLVAWLYKWIDSVGGVKIAWAIAMDKIKSTWDWTYIGLITGVNWVLDKFDLFKLGMKTASVGIQDIMGDMKTGTLMILESMINGAIDIINGFIDVVNRIPGVSIDAVEKVAFGTNAELENHAAVQQRHADLEEYSSGIYDAIVEREADLERLRANAVQASVQRQAEIEEMRSQAQRDVFDPTESIENALSNAGITDALESVSGNSAKIAKTVSAKDEDIRLMKDIAEQNVFNRFAGINVKINMNNENHISSEMDIDGVVDRLTERLEEEIYAGAEGIHE